MHQEADRNCPNYIQEIFVLTSSEGEEEKKHKINIPLFSMVSYISFRLNFSKLLLVGQCKFGSGQSIDRNYPVLHVIYKLVLTC